MMDFISYAVFMMVGIVIGALLGRRVMRWAWGANQETRDTVIGWVALVTAIAYYIAMKGWALR